MPNRVLVSFLAMAALGCLYLTGMGQDQAADSKNLVGHTDPVYSVDFTADGALIVTGSFDKTLKLWDAATRKVVRTFSGHTGRI